MTLLNSIMVSSPPSLGSKEATDWMISVLCALKREHELSVHVACRCKLDHIHMDKWVYIWAPVTRAHSKLIHFQRAYAQVREVAMTLTWIKISMRYSASRRVYTMYADLEATYSLFSKHSHTGFDQSDTWNRPRYLLMCIVYWIYLIWSWPNFPALVEISQ